MKDEVKVAKLVEELKLQMATEYEFSILREFEEKLETSKILASEEWRDIEGYDGFYQISNFGRIKSFRRKECKIFKRFITEQGYTIACLIKNQKRKRYYVHVLVAKAFVANPENKPFVNHIDGNKSNNCFLNLEWVTNSENQKHAYRLGLSKRKEGIFHHQAKLTEEQVRYIRENHKPRDKEFSQSALAKKFGVTKTIIRNVVVFSTYKNVN